MITFEKVEESLKNARGIAFDNCHKIYVLMDDEQMVEMREYDYDPLISADDMAADEMLATIKKWFDESCALRFVSAVRTVKGNPNEGFTTLIAQGESDEDESECEDCGMGDYNCVCFDEDESDDDDE